MLARMLSPVQSDALAWAWVKQLTRQCSIRNLHWHMNLAVTLLQPLQLKMSLQAAQQLILAELGLNGNWAAA